MLVGLPEKIFHFTITETLQMAISVVHVEGPKIQCFDQDFEKNNFKIAIPPVFFDHFT